MNMAKIEARAAELHEGCRMPMEQARELAASEMSEGRKALLAAFGAAAAAREQDLRGQYPKAARVLAEEVFSLRAALRQKHAEYEDMKSLLLGNVRNLNLECERLRLKCSEHQDGRLAALERAAALERRLQEIGDLAASSATGPAQLESLKMIEDLCVLGPNARFSGGRRPSAGTDS